MRFTAKLLALLVLLTLSASPSFADMKDDVTAAYSAWDSAFNAGDAKAVAASYAEDAVFLPATHDVVKGPAGVEKFFAGLFGMGVTGHKLELIEARESGDMVVAAAKWSAKGKDLRRRRPALGRRGDACVPKAGRRQPEARPAHF